MTLQTHRIERSFTQQDFDAFAELSGDWNPIHIDPEFSARSRFGRTVAHGLLLLGVIRELIAELVPGRRMRQQEAMFPAPTYADEPMRFECRVISSEPGAEKVEFRVSRVVGGETTCQGQCRLETL